MERVNKELEKYKSEDYVHDQDVGYINGHLQSIVINELKDYITGKDVLDIGCNTGLVTFLINKEKPNVLVGIDVNQKALDLATKRLPDHVFLRHSITEKGILKGAEFDTIFMFSTFEHILEEDKDKVKQNLYDLLKPKGKVILWLPWAIKGSGHERNKQMAFDPHHNSFYYTESDVYKEFESHFKKMKIKKETRTNPGDKRPHFAWIIILEK